MNFIVLPCFAAGESTGFAYAAKAVPVAQRLGIIGTARAAPLRCGGFVPIF
jgi:hypothetical protein